MPACPRLCTLGTCRQCLEHARQRTFTPKGEAALDPQAIGLAQKWLQRIAISKKVSPSRPNLGGERENAGLNLFVPEVREQPTRGSEALEPGLSLEERGEELRVKPDLEVVQIGHRESFKAWEHGYPFRTVRWHFHPEYEIHHVVETSGRYFVGDFIGTFEPGNLVLTGPNLPHNWVSDVQPGESVPLRGRVVQFSETFIANAKALLPEFASCTPMLELSRRGVLFTPETASRVGPMLAELVQAKGFRRIEGFMSIVGILSRAVDARLLTSADYLPDPSGFMSTGINKALAYISQNLTEPFSQTDLAEIADVTSSTFSRSFRRHTGMSLVQYVNRLRINLACQLLMSEADMPITEICFAAGFNNLSNFNRQFLAQKGMPPSRFRALLAENIGPAEAASAGGAEEETHYLGVEIAEQPPPGTTGVR